jgi:spore coat protein H
VSYTRFILFGIMLAVINSCYKEVELPPVPEVVFELSVSPEMQEFISVSRDTSYTIDEPGMEFLLGKEQLKLKVIKTRGKSALRYQRKSFAVVLHEELSLPGRNGLDRVQLRRFKLISMAMDYTYIENRIGLGILEEQGVMPLFYRFVELRINGDTQGIYLLMEDPEQYFLETGSEFILRRGYHNSITDVEYSPFYQNIPRENYEMRFKEIYSSLASLQGEALYNALNERLDLEQYFRKMGIDYLLQNGDYTDEVYLYALLHQDKPRFSIIPWDYDDLFRSYPHEVGLTWGTGRLLGDRHYATHQDILDEIGDKMIFSIEDDLDYSIAIDPYLYARYESTLVAMLEKMDLEDIDAIFEQVRSELIPFYYQEELVAQSRFDQHETSFSIWEENMEEKKAFLKERLAGMKAQLKEVQL